MIKSTGTTLALIAYAASAQAQTLSFDAAMIKPVASEQVSTEIQNSPFFRTDARVNAMPDTALNLLGAEPLQASDAPQLDWSISPIEVYASTEAFSDAITHLPAFDDAKSTFATEATPYQAPNALRRSVAHGGLSGLIEQDFDKTDRIIGARTRF